MGRKQVVLGGLLVGLFLGTGELTAQSRFGGQVSFGDDADLGLGGRVLLDFSTALTGLAFIGSFDYFFPDNVGVNANTEANYWEFNGNAVIEFGIASAPNLQPYIGGGVNFAHASVDKNSPDAPEDSSQNDLALNVLAGFKFPLAGLTPFAELRFTFAGDDTFLVRQGSQIVLTGGLLFP